VVSERRRRIVFTDLDGTLLRHEDYDWSAARGAVAELAQRAIPLVIASSKTRAEIEAWRSRLGNHDPFISENGGALYVPPGWTPRPLPGATETGRYLCVRFGTAYPRLRRALRRIARGAGVPLRGFGDMDAGEIERLTGLTGEDLLLAKEREYDEPFITGRALDSGEEARLHEIAGALGLRVTRGGRFRHLIGQNSKGAAARLLISAYETDDARVRSLGLGDGPNDLELLRAVDVPVVVARADGTHAPELAEALPHARFTSGIGPEGFNQAVLEFLSRPR
jgi:mannosyl-3-phosphoglycerate phosphatase